MRIYLIFSLLNFHLLYGSQSFEKQLNEAFASLVSKNGSNHSLNRFNNNKIRTNPLSANNNALLKSCFVGSITLVAAYKVTHGENVQLMITSTALATLIAYNHFRKK